MTWMSCRPRPVEHTGAGINHGQVARPKRSDGRGKARTAKDYRPKKVKGSRVKVQTPPGWPGRSKQAATWRTTHRSLR